MMHDESMNEGITEEIHHDPQEDADEKGVFFDGDLSEEDEDTSYEIDDSESESDDKQSDSKEMIAVAIDWIEFEGALENNSPELHSFLNKITGDVVRVFESGDSSELQLKEAEESDEYLYIDPISSREQYRWMEEFIEIIEEPTLKDKLNIAIDGKGAFRRFKDVLVGYPKEREQWFSKRSVKLRNHMMEWLESKNIEPTNVPPWEGDGESTHSDESRRQRFNDDSRAWREGAADLRSVAHDMLDLVPARELPSALAFLEFLRSRRGYRRSRYG